MVSEAYSYSNIMNKYPILSSAEQINLFKDWKNNKNKRSLDKLILSNLKIVSKEAYKASSINKFVDYEDLFQEGVAGLIKASEKFDEERGTGFLTYAMWWVRAYIKRYVMDQKSLVRMGKSEGERAVFSGLRKAQFVADENNWSGSSRVKNIAKLLNVKETTLTEMIQRLSACDQSLDAPIKNSEDGQLRVTALLDENYKDENDLSCALHQLSAMSAIDFALETLSEKEQFVVRQRFFNNEEPSLREVGEKLSMTKEGVRIIEKRSLEKIRKYISKHHGIVNI